MTDETGATAYAVRLRTIGGRLEIVGDTTYDVATARDGVVSLQADLREALRYRISEETEEAAENAFLEDWWPNGIESSPFSEGKEVLSGWPRVHYPHIDEESLLDIPNLFPIILSHTRKDRIYYTSAYKDLTGYLCWPGPWADELRNCILGMEHAAALRVAQWEQLNLSTCPRQGFFR